MKARKKKLSAVQQQQLRAEQFVERARIERVAKTADNLNAFVGRHVAELETAMREILQNPDSVVPLRRVAYVTRELKSYVSMVERDQSSYGKASRIAE